MKLFRKKSAKVEKKSTSRKFKLNINLAGFLSKILKKMTPRFVKKFFEQIYGMRLSSKVYTAFAFVMISMLSFAALTYWTADRGKSSLVKIYNEKVRPTNQLKNIQDNLKEYDRVILSFLSKQVPGPFTAKKTRELTRNIQSDIGLLNKNKKIFTEKELETMDFLTKTSNEIEDFNKKMRNALQENDFPFVTELFEDEWQSLVAELNAPITQIVKSFEDKIGDQFKAEEKAVEKILVAILGIIAGFTILGLYLVKKSINFVRVFENMTKDLLMTNEQLAGISGKINKSTSDLEAASTVQGSKIQEVFNGISEMNNSFKNELGQIENVKENANKAKKASLEGAEMMKEINNSIEELTDFTRNLEEINEVMHDIDSKTSVVKDIAFRSTILSFNAGLEAERAGSHGRGFSVIAEEVGNLSKMSGEQAKKINSIVKDSVRRVREITESFNKIASAANTKGQETIEGFNAILASVDGLSEELQEIIQSSLQNREESGRVERAVGYIEDLSRKNNNKFQEFTQISDSLLQENEQLSQRISTLQNLVLGINYNSEKERRKRESKERLKDRKRRLRNKEKNKKAA